jgi:hypothetical protein
MGRGRKKVADDVILEAYKRLENVWLVGKEVGLCGQSIHERLLRLNVLNKINVFTEKDKKKLQDKYQFYKNQGSLDILAKEMGRTKQFICRQAAAMSLTNRKSLKPYAEKKESNPYAKYHARVRAKKGSPHKCEICGEDSPHKQYDWANLTGRYEDPDDYRRMCRVCHRKYDKDRPMLVHK